MASIQLSIGLSVTFVLAAAFILHPKRLHPLELAFGALVSVFFYLVYFLVVSVNWRWFEVSTAPDLWIDYVLFRFIVTPILVLSCLQFIHTTRRLTVKLAYLLAFAGVLTTFTFLCCVSGILSYHMWSPIGIYLIWLSHLLSVGLCCFCYRMLLRGEVKLT